MLWDLNDGKHLYTLSGGDIINAMTFSPNRYWLCAAVGPSIKIWLKQCGKPSVHLDLKYPAKGIGVHRDLSDGAVKLNQLMELRLTLKRDKNLLRVKAGVYSCILRTCTQVIPLMPNQIVCVDMSKCKGYNTSSDFPCNPSIPPTFPSTFPSSPISRKGTIGVSSSTTSPPNPECPSMHRSAKSLEKALTLYTKEKTKCQVNQLCSGLMCNGTHHGNDFFMRFELKQCGKPSVHLDLKYPAKGIGVHRDLSDGAVKLNQLMELRLTLKRDKNLLQVEAGVYSCFLGTCTKVIPLMPKQIVCVDMSKCKGYNTSSDFPCNPSIPPTFPSTFPSSPISRKGQMTGPTGSTSTTPSNGVIYAHRKDPDAHHMSVGMAVGIGVACLFGILIIIGSVFYYRRFRRSRLRAAYYNDISMNDPLYEDFGPEIA
ncbi:predicted protein [Nematostella vectensis]|uniref:Uncharacterized protein n=1 Tax=Nematostella vectensis TaxID=45351 RepID=A7S9A6_NEMVE|nr:predicted protein [Nematostella vectensis]|eukprot:XP_001631785.1 predicted protein [Nematostella vectensis]